MINEKRKVVIEGRIIRLQDIRTLAYYIEDLAKEDENAKWRRLSFDAVCADDSAFESNSSDIFEEHSAITRKRVETISMSYSSDQYDRRVTVELRHGSYHIASGLTVSGSDSRWVNGVVKHLCEIIDATPPQNQFVSKYRGWILFILSACYGFILMPLLFFVMKYISDSPSEQVDTVWTQAQLIRAYFMYYFLLLFIGFFPASFTVTKLMSLWPPIELQIGPEHTDLEKLRRRWLAAIFITAILPILVSTVYDVVKAMWY